MNETLFNTTNCGYRLPCGLCTRTYMQCPYAFPASTEITCTTSDTTREVINGISTDKHTTKMGC